MDSNATKTGRQKKTVRGRSWWSNISVGGRLGIGFTTLIVLLISVLVVDAQTSNRQNQLTTSLLTKLIPVRVATKGVLYGIRATDDDGAWYVMTTNSKQAAELLSRYYLTDLLQLDANLKILEQYAHTADMHKDVTTFVKFYYGSKATYSTTSSEIVAVAQNEIRKHGITASLASIGNLQGYDGYLTGNEQAFAAKNTGHYQQALNFYVSIPYIQSLAAIQDYQSDVQAEIDKTSAEQTSAAQLVQWLNLIVGLFAIVLGAGIAYLITRSLTAPLRRLTAIAQRIESGETSINVTVDRGDELGVLAQAFGSMVRSLVSSQENTRQKAQALADGVTQLIDELAPVVEGDLTARPRITAEGGDISVVADFTGVLIDSFAEVATLVRSASSEVQTTSEDLIGRIQQLANNVQERTLQVNATAAISEQIAESAGDVLTNIEQVQSSTQAAIDSVGKGNSAVSQSLERMDTVRAAMIQATRQIKKLSDSAVAMNSTVGLVLQFAGDLELLADNAQIEAARHSEAGGVFTAVAEQTGRLAEDAQKALTEIQTAVLSNRRETAEVGRQIEQVATEVVASARAVEDARAAFATITQTVQELGTFVERVSSLANAQVRVAKDVNESMHQIVNFFGATLNDVRTSEYDTLQLRQTINGLRDSIAKLKLASSDDVLSKAA